MNQNELKYIAKKYSHNSAGRSEKEALELFYKKLQDKNRHLLVETGINRRNRILKNVLQNPKIPSHKGDLKYKWIYPAIAGIIAVLLTLSIFSNFLKTENYILRSTAKGEQRIITLTDGSRITLNSNSSIKYPEQFGDIREVYLEGEAFFKVHRNPEQPFIVQTSSIKTRVLGTSFNINAPSKNKAMVSVNTGVVEVSMDRTRRKIKLHKNEQVEYRKKHFILSSGDSKDYSAWTEKIIVLNNKTLAETAKILQNWYDVTIEFQNPEIKELRISGKFRDESLENVLESIALLKGLKIKEITQNHFVIRKKKIENYPKKK